MNSCSMRLAINEDGLFDPNKSCSSKKIVACEDVGLRTLRIYLTSTFCKNLKDVSKK